MCHTNIFSHFICISKWLRWFCFLSNIYKRDLQISFLYFRHQFYFLSQYIRDLEGEFFQPPPIPVPCIFRKDPKSRILLNRDKRGKGSW